MKYSTVAALALGLAVVGLLVLYALRALLPTKEIMYILGGLLVLAAFMWDSSKVDGWIRLLIDHLPGLKRKNGNGGSVK